MFEKDDIKATSRKLQDEIQEAVHYLYQSLVAILERVNHTTCGKGSYVVFCCLVIVGRTLVSLLSKHSHVYQSFQLGQVQK